MNIKYFPATTGIGMSATENYNIRYFPAVSFTLDSNYEINNRHISWYKKNSIIQHPYMLVSYGHKPSKPVKEYVDENMVIMGDSGGLQTMTTGVQFNPIDVINWHNENCDIGFTLDMPPIDNLFDHKSVSNNRFIECINKSNSNANIMIEKKSEDLKLYLVIQGDTEKKRQDWLNGGLKEHSNWDGCSLSVKPQSDPYALADWLLFAKKNNLRNIHILGVSGSNTLPVIVYLAKYFDNVYFDSSSYAIGSQYRSYNLPYSNTKLSLASLKSNDGIPKVMPCDCPVCSQIKDTSIFTSEETGKAGWLINMHNLWNTQRQLIFLEGIVYNKEIFLNEIGQKAQDTIQYIDNRLSGIQQLTF